MSRIPLWRIDATLMPRSFLRECVSRFLLLLLLSGYFTVMILSGGPYRYLSERWTVTAVLRSSVSAAEGEGIAKKAASLPGVGSAAYKDPETSWKEFLDAYPGLESLRTAGASPLPGYIEVRVRRDRFAEADIRAVEAALKPLPEVEMVLLGAESLPSLLRAAGWSSVFFRAVLAVLCIAAFAIFHLQEKARAVGLSGDFDFLKERGISFRRIALARAAGSALVCGSLSLAAVAASSGAYYLLESRLSQLRRVIGPSSEILTLPVLVPLILFICAAALLSGGASLLGWRAARSGRK
ncbi:MAG: hypothetical protein HY896_14210 [Deltaproteobacteria bacterium]|nr:hypothetical protein [Deltaproteobacteria bacterium]